MYLTVIRVTYIGAFHLVHKKNDTVLVKGYLMKLRLFCCTFNGNMMEKVKANYREIRIHQKVGGGGAANPFIWTVSRDLLG